jgi:hypothetical protein
LVPTISTVPRRAVSWRTNLAASWNIGSDFSRLMMWILLRWPKDERGHLGVPEAGLVSEMDAGFQHFAHGD